MKRVVLSFFMCVILLFCIGCEGAQQADTGQILGLFAEVYPENWENTSYQQQLLATKYADYNRHMPAAEYAK